MSTLRRALAAFSNNFPLRLALLYAILAALWIATGDRLVLQFLAPAQQPLVNTLKGWGFVVITAVLLFLLVRHDQRQRDQLSLRQRRLAYLVESIPDALVLLDANAQITYANHIVYQGLGVADPTLTGQPLTHLGNLTIDPDERRAFFADLLANPNQNLVRQFRVMLPGHTERFFEVTSVNLLHNPEIAAIAIIARDVTERNQRDSNLARFNRQLDALNKISLAITRRRNPEPILTDIVADARGLLAADGAGLWRYDEEDATLHWDIADGPHNIGLTLKAGEGLVGQVALHHQPMMTGAYPTEPYAAPQFARQPWLSLAAAPILQSDSLTAVLVVFSAAPNNFTATDLDLLSRLANLAAVALQNAELITRLSAASRAQQALATRLLDAQEQERRQIALDLHDQIGQALTAANLSLRTIQRQSAASPELTPHLEQATAAVKQALQVTRDLSRSLRPAVLDDLGLSAALRWLAEELMRSSGLTIYTDIVELTDRLSPAVETACFRIAQEATTNALRHSQSTELELRLRHRADVLILSVHDNGIGFDPIHHRNNASHGHSLGLLGMQERAQHANGWLNIWSEPSIGTHIQAVFRLEPIPTPEPESP